MNYQAIFEKYPPTREHLIMILHDIQQAEPRRFISEEAMERTARYLNTTRAAVYGVVGYYSMFSAVPRGRHIIRLCTSPVCKMKGSFDLQAALSAELGIRMGETSSDGVFTLESSECLGNCHNAPTMMIDELLYSGVTGEKLGAILQRARNRGVEA